MSHVDLIVEVSKKKLKLVSDKKRIQQVMVSIFESAALEIPHGGVIRINLSTKPLSNEEREKTVQNPEICDY